MEKHLLILMETENSFMNWSNLQGYLKNQKFTQTLDIKRRITSK